MGIIFKLIPVAKVIACSLLVWSQIPMLSLVDKDSVLNNIVDSQTIGFLSNRNLIVIFRYTPALFT